MPTDVRFMIVAPGHFHAALVQKEMYPGVSKRVDVYAPLGPDLLEHLRRIAAFNHRTDRPTSWEVEVHAAPDFMDRLLRDRPGTVVILSGRNRDKIGQISAAVGAGLHVLADKPWILKSSDIPTLESTLAAADATGVVAYDIMTERFEVANILQRALVNDAAVFGEIDGGSEAAPAVYMESVHYLKKVVAGVPNIRPAWFFDSSEQGEGLNDVGTHLVDLAQWTLFPDQGLDYQSDVAVLTAQRWPTWIPESEFRSVTNAPRFPDSLTPSVTDGRLEYYCNTLVSYSLRGVHVKLNVVWDWEAAPGAGDTHFASYQGTRARVEVRQTSADRFRQELFVVPGVGLEADVQSAVRARVDAVQDQFSGVAVEDRGSELRVTIPDTFRVGHEAHFAQVTASFLGYLADRGSLPAWERPSMLAKYYVSTRGTELSRAGAPKPAPRLAPH